MERGINLHIKKLPEGLYFATSEEIPGLVAQGRTVIETLEIARDVARKLLEAQKERQESPQFNNANSTRASHFTPSSDYKRQISGQIQL